MLGESRMTTVQHGTRGTRKTGYYFASPTPPGVASEIGMRVAVVRCLPRIVLCRVSETVTT